MLNFDQNSNIEKLEEEIWVYKNFLSTEEVEGLLKVANNLTEEDWNSAKNAIAWYNGKTSPALEDLKPINARIADLVAPDYEPTANLSFTRMFPGDSMHEHEDTCGEDEATSNDDFGTCAITRYGVVVYINDNFTGGEIYYPSLNMSYTPVPGDLLIHGARIRHGVAEVTSGIRYAYASFLIDKGAK
jgi:hypothetical protein